MVKKIRCLTSHILILFGQDSFNELGILLAQFLDYLVRPAVQKLAGV